ncbi:unnamed protein product, partial [Sphagnum tenellum]
SRSPTPIYVSDDESDIVEDAGEREQVDLIVILPRDVVVLPTDLIKDTGSSTSQTLQEEKGEKEKRSVVLDETESDSESERSSYFSRSRSPALPSDSDELPATIDENQFQYDITIPSSNAVLSVNPVEVTETCSSQTLQEEKGEKEKEIKSENSEETALDQEAEEMVQAFLRSVQAAMRQFGTRKNFISQMTKGFLATISGNKVPSLLASELSMTDIKEIIRESGVQLEPKEEQLADVNLETKTERTDVKTELSECEIQDLVDYRC